MSELKTTELRLGNYIKYGADTLSVKQFTERTILLNGLRGTLINIDSESAEPIQLTESWLINFGFIKSREDLFLLRIPEISAELHFEIHSYGKLLCVHGSCGQLIPEVSLFVHSVQNLYFALTGKELTHQKIN